MPDTAVAAASPAKGAKKVAKKVAKKPMEHPKYSDMVITAIKELKERKGSSRQAVAKYVKKEYKVKDNADTHIKAALKKGVTSGALKQVKGTGASGSFKVADKAKVKKPKKAAAKKSSAKKAPKKTVKKVKAAKKPKKKVVKKPAAAAKKPVAKKPAAKKATKKPAKKAGGKKKAAAKKTSKK